jgi:glycine C-acetyltransferase
MDVHDLEFLQNQVQQLKDDGVYRKIPVIESANEAEVLIDGRKVINLCSNNYLGFANHPRLKQAAIEAIEKYGVGAGAVKTIVGNMDIHEQLEAELAKLRKKKRSCCFNPGFNCNAGVIQAITQAGDLIVSDEY